MRILRVEIVSVWTALSQVDFQISLDDRYSRLIYKGFVSNTYFFGISGTILLAGYRWINMEYHNRLMCGL